MPKDPFLIISDFTPGWHKRDDDSRIPLGGARIASNITLTPRKGIAPRAGELLIGESNSGSAGTRLFSFHKSMGSDLLIKFYEDEMEYYSNKGEAWARVMDGYTSGLKFGGTESRVDATDVLDWFSFGNGIDPFSRWCGYDALIDGALVGGETEVVVDTTLIDEVYFSGTASSCTTTTIVMPAGTWATDIWNTFYVRITSGAQAGYVSLISATTATQITFATITGLSGTPTFEIRKLAVPATGTLVYGGNKVAYTGVTKDNAFAVASASAAADGTVLTVAPVVYNSNPKGNIFESFLETLLVSGNSAKPVTVFRSKMADTDDFTIGSPRAANEGDVVYFPFGGKRITDVKRWEDQVIVLKEDSIEQLSWSQTTNATGGVTDIAVQSALKVGQKVGSIGRSWNVEDDIMFVTPDNRITSLGRVLNRDVRPQTEDIAYNIRREVANYVFDDVAGTEHITESFISGKSDNTVTSNDRLLVWNKDYQSWEGVWSIQAADIVPHEGDLYYLDAYSPNVYKMLTGINKIRGEDEFPISSRWVSGWINKYGNGFYLNEVSSIAVEGRIRLNTTINVKLYKDYSVDSFQDLSITAAEEIIDGQSHFNLLGTVGNGLEPLGTGSLLGDEDDDGYRHFIAFLYFPMTQLEYISVGVSTADLNQGWEVIRLGINATDTVFENMNRVLT